MEELWAPIPDHPNYVISNFGRVYNKADKRYLTPRPNVNGALRVALPGPRGKLEVVVARAVARAFLPGYELDDIVRYVNGNPNNCRVDNLFLEESGRINHVRQKPARPRERHWGRKIYIIETKEVFKSVRDCADHIGGDYATIYACLNGRRQRHKGYSFDWVYE